MNNQTLQKTEKKVNKDFMLFVMASEVDTLKEKVKVLEEAMVEQIKLNQTILEIIKERT